MIIEKKKIEQNSDFPHNATPSPTIFIIIPLCKGLHKFSLLYCIHPKLLCLGYAIANLYKGTLFGLEMAWSLFG